MPVDHNKPAKGPLGQGHDHLTTNKSEATRWNGVNRPPRGHAETNGEKESAQCMDTVGGDGGARCTAPATIGAYCQWHGRGERTGI